MNRLPGLILGVTLLTAACGDTSPTEPSAGTTTTSTFTVPLSAANQVPAITNADASSTGSAVIALIVSRNGAGDITAATANFRITVAGFAAGTRVTDAHIHNGPAGSNASIFIATALTPGELALVDGGGSVAKNGVAVPVDRAAAILSNPAGHYFNVHTGLNPDGAIRGQLGTPVTTAGASDPY